MLTDPVDTKDNRFRAKRVTSDIVCATAATIAEFHFLRYRNTLGANGTHERVAFRPASNTPTGKKYAY